PSTIPKFWADVLATDPRTLIMMVRAAIHVLRCAMFLPPSWGSSAQRRPRSSETRPAPADAARFVATGVDSPPVMGGATLGPALQVTVAARSQRAITPGRVNRRVWR